MQRHRQHQAQEQRPIQGRSFFFYYSYLIQSLTGSTTDVTSIRNTANIISTADITSTANIVKMDTTMSETTNKNENTGKFNFKW